MNVALKNQEIIILTDKGNTLKPDYSDKDKIRDVYGGNFLEIKDFYEKLRRLHKKTSMYVLISNDEFIDAESQYTAIGKPLAKKHLDEIFRSDHKLNILFVLRRKSFDNLYEEGLKKIIPKLEDVNLIFVGASSIKSKLINDGNWNENFHFFKRVGVVRIGRENQKKIIELMRLKAES